MSLVQNFSLAWREMHVKTDVFCSAAVVLPDKAARILTVGGYSSQSTFGLRLYAPDGSAGVNGTNDWEEDPNNLKLQVDAAAHLLLQRWFSKRHTEWTLVSDCAYSVERQCSRNRRREWPEWPAPADARDSPSHTRWRYRGVPGLA